jgi:hypothetical protein
VADAMKGGGHVVSKQAKSFDVGHHLPSLRILVICALVVTAAALFAGPRFATRWRNAASGGAISNHHRLIEADCAKCHSSPFRAVPDEKCTTCHVANPHTKTMPELVSAHPEFKLRCVSCHKEHHGEASLIQHDSRLCTRCHAQINQLAPSTTQPSIPDFAHHPEFAVLAWRGNTSELVKARLDEPNLRDSNQLKFSHSAHLDRKGAPGQLSLECKSCHVTGDDGKQMQPISYARHCERCHPIKFDPRLKDSFLPHGDAKKAFMSIKAELARLYVERGLAPVSPQSPSESPDTEREKRRKKKERRTQRPKAQAEPEAGLGIDPKKLDEESRDDELGLFTPGGACFMCHDVEKVAPSETANQPRFLVLSPRLPVKKMPAARFDHDAHRLESCESCHGKVRESTSASDILLPRIARCRECHADSGKPGKVDSPCLQCHGHHLPK